MGRENLLGILWVLAAIQFSCSGNDRTRLDQVQLIGSHNSYKIPIEEPLWRYLYEKDSAVALSLQYGHPSLPAQLDMGLRTLEFDVFHDPLGGHFSGPKGLEIVREAGKIPVAYDQDERLKEPGLKMFHIQDIDFRSHHLLFKEGLQTLKQWSDGHPGHTPVVVLINAKDKKLPRLREPLEFTAAALDSIDMEIRNVFPSSYLITPDRVRGRFETLEEAVLSGGWPELESVRGRFLFVLDENGEKIKRYLETYPGLKGAVLFVNSEEGNPEAAFRIINDPVKDFGKIRDLVRKGYMVRTRADAGTKEARTNDYERFESAKASGAQVISTDYYIPADLFPSTFQIIFGNGGYERLRKDQNGKDSGVSDH